MNRKVFVVAGRVELNVADHVGSGVLFDAGVLAHQVVNGGEVVEFRRDFVGRKSRGRPACWPRHRGRLRWSPCAQTKRDVNGQRAKPALARCGLQIGGFDCGFELLVRRFRLLSAASWSVSKTASSSALVNRIVWAVSYSLSLGIERAAPCHRRCRNPKFFCAATSAYCREIGIGVEPLLHQVAARRRERVARWPFIAVLKGVASGADCA